MTFSLPLTLVAIAVISFTAYAQEVAYAYDDLVGRPLESGNITQYNGTDVVTFAVASGGPSGATLLQKFPTTVEEMKNEINLKLNVGNPEVREKGCNLTLDYPGDGTISQICSIYNYMVGNWSYLPDPRGFEVFQYSNESLKLGSGKYSGQGDCDDFSILLASLIESIGCTSRIVLAYGPDGGHAYTEVYLGKTGGTESDVGRMVSWLKKKYNVNEINTHMDLNTGDVWLNLDWWRDPRGAKHPGGPFFKANSQVPIHVREGVPYKPLKPVNDIPIARFTISPEVPNAEENTNFNASMSKDIGGGIVAYEWDFGDGNNTVKLSGPLVSHVYHNGGPYTVILKVEDNDDTKRETNITYQNITINNPPQANFTITPQKPLVGDFVKFDASASSDVEDGTNLAYNWQINNNSALFSQASPPKQGYDEKGMYWINLTVTDKNGAEGHKNFLLKINQPPIPRIAFDSANSNLGKMINFSAVDSEDLDGEIVSYAWDFGDKSPADYNKAVQHSYREGGEKMVMLSVRDNDGAISNTSLEIFINRPPVARFSIDPVWPKRGEPVSFDASASSDPDGKIQRYLWDFGVGMAESEVYYSKFAEHSYSRPMKYNITLTVEDDKGATDSFNQSVEVGEINNKPVIISLHSDKSSPQKAGTIVTWKTEASDAENDPIQYKFFLDDMPQTDWSSNPAWTWTTSDDDFGSHLIEIKVRDGKHNSEGDGSKMSRFIITDKTRYCISLMPFSYNYTDGRGSSMCLTPAKGATNAANDTSGATNITYDLIDDGYVGVTKKIKLRAATPP